MSSEEILQTQYNNLKRINYSKLKSRLILQKVKWNQSGLDYILEMNRNGRDIFRNFYNKGKNVYVDGLPTVKVDSNKTNSNLPGIKAYIAAIENCTVEDITYCSVNESNDIPYYLSYLIQDYEHIPQDILITDDLFSYYLNRGYTYTFSPITNEITFNKVNTTSVIYEYTDIISSITESYTYTDDDGYEVEAIRFKDLDSNTWIGPNDGIIEPKTRLEFINKTDSNDKRYITFMSGSDINPYNYIPFLPNTSKYNFNEVSYVDYTVNNVDKRILFSIPDQNTVTYNNKTYKLFNDPNAASKTVHMYPIVTLRFRNADVQGIKEHSEELTDWYVQGADSFFTIERYKTTKSILKTLGYKLDEITDNWRYEDPKAKEKVTNENLSKVYSIFLFFGIGNLRDIQEQIDGKTVTIDGEQKIIKGDTDAEVLIKYLYNMLEYFNDTNIYIYSREVVHRMIHWFYNITKTVTNKNTNKLPKAKYSIWTVGDWYPTSGYSGTRWDYVPTNAGRSEIHIKKDEGNKETEYKFNFGTVTNIYMETVSVNGKPDGRHGKSVWSDYEPVIPLIKEIVDKLSAQDKCRLLTYCTQLEMQVAYRQKLKWYQTVEFQIATIIVQFAIILVLCVLQQYHLAALVVKGVMTATQASLQTFIFALTSIGSMAISQMNINPIMKGVLQLGLTAIGLSQTNFSTLFSSQISIYEAIQLANMPIQVANILTQTYYSLQGMELQKRLNAFTETAQDRTDYMASMDIDILNQSYLMIDGTTLFGQDIRPVLSGTSIVYLNNCYKEFNILYERGVSHFYDNIFMLRYDYNEN